MKPPEVTIGLPVYNGENYVEEAVASFLNQDFRDFELIISDNHSQDRTEEICRKLKESDNRIRYFRTGMNIGAAPNFNRCVELARGRYFKWAAHDDFCHHEYLRACLDALKREENIILCHTDPIIVNDVGKVMEGHRHSVPLTRSVRQQLKCKETHLRFRHMAALGHPCLDVFGVIRLSVLRETRLIGSWIGSDRNLLAELALRGGIKRLRDRYFFSREHDDRSIRKIPLRQKGQWFDPRNRGRQYFRWRTLIEFERSINRVKLTARDWFLCQTELIKWIRNYWRDLAYDFSKS